MNILTKQFTTISALCCMLLLQTTILRAASAIEYTNNMSGSAVTWWGTQKTEQYDVAIRLDGKLFAGMDISEISFPVVTDDEVTDFKIWMSESLTLENKQNVADIMTADATVSGGTAKTTLAQPYRIPESGVYVGLSFNVAKRETDAQKLPLPLVAATADNNHGLYIHSSRTYSSWTDLSASRGQQIAFSVVLGNVPETAVSLALPEEITTAVGLPAKVKAELANHGTEAIELLTLDYTAGTQTGTVEVLLAEPVATGFNTSATVGFELPAFSEKQSSELHIKLTKVNGKANADAAADGATQLCVVAYMPVNRPLFEEYTGTGCGYCPRGPIGIERMRELVGDRFVAVAHHCDDIMSIFEAEDRPSPAPGQPVTWINRTKETDPYFGDSPVGITGTFDIARVWQEMADSFTPADLTLTCAWADDSREAIDVTATVTFVKDYASADYRVAYMLVADGLKGETADWLQSNYYTGGTGKWPADFDFFVNAGQYVYGLTYDDVVICAPSVKGIEGSLPADIVAEVPMTHTGRLNLSEAVSLDGEYLVQDKSKLSVVAVVIDAATGAVVNSAKAVPNGTSAVGTVRSDNSVVSVSHYDLSGRRITTPGYKGIVITTTTYADGSTKTVKTEKFKTLQSE